jgi:nitrous oxidase accessory protein NosD
VQLKASAALTFPGVGGWNIKDAVVEGITIAGNRRKSAQFVDGCRVGGIYLHECDRVVIRNCTVREYNGDGIVCGVSRHVTVEDCVSEGNAGHGLHPGSGSLAPIFRRNRVERNGQDGLFVCWRVKNGRFEANELQGNQGDGISIGHKDTDNFFRGNSIVKNAKAGIRFRTETEPMGAHRNVFEENTILDNSDQEACIVMYGHHHDVVFRKNRIGHSQGPARGVGVAAGEGTSGLIVETNDFANVRTEVHKK